MKKQLKQPASVRERIMCSLSWNQHTFFIGVISGENVLPSPFSIFFPVLLQNPTPCCGFLWDTEEKNNKGETKVSAVPTKHEAPSGLTPAVRWKTQVQEESREKTLALGGGGRVFKDQLVPQRRFWAIREPTTTPVTSVIPASNHFLKLSCDLRLSAAASWPKSSAKCSWNKKEGRKHELILRDTCSKIMWMEWVGPGDKNQKNCICTF